MEDLFVPRAGMSCTHMSNGCIIAALTCISWYNIFCMLYGPILKFLFDGGDSSSSEQSCQLHRTPRTPHESEVYGSLMFLLYGPEQQADLAGGSVLLGAEQLFSLCFSLRIPASLPAAPEAHEAALMECTKHFQTALVRDRHLSYFTLPKPPAWIYTLGNCWICGGLISLPFGALALCFVQCMRAESYSSVSASQCGVGGQVTNPAPENAQTMLWFIPGSFSPSVSGVKILDLEFVRNFQKVASFPSSRFTSHLHLLVLSVWLCLFNA